MNPSDVQPQLDPSVTKKLKEIIEKDISALTEDDKAFLKARKSYLGKSAQAKFAQVLSEKSKEKLKEVGNIDPVKDLSAHPADDKEELDDSDDDESDE